MSATDGRWEGATPFTDGQVFIRDAFQVLSGAPVWTRAGAGLLSLNGVASATTNLMACVDQLFRTGQLATAAISQEQFGTAALQPGPSSVANTGGPSALPPGFPPWLNSVNPALTGGLKGPIPKGFQVNYIDTILEIDTLALTSATVGLTLTKFAAAGAAAAPIVSNLLALANNGLPVATNTAGQATRTRVIPTLLQFNIADASEMILEYNFVTPATSTFKFYGAVLGVTFNYN